MARLTIQQFTAFFQWYRGEAHQQLAVAELWKAMPVSLLEDDADWVLTYRNPAVEEDPEVPVALPGKQSELDWDGATAMAKKAGAKYPEVAAAQCVLESGWFKHETGAFNILGIKATAGEPYSLCTTWELYGGKDVTIQDKFKDFDSYQECIDQLVTQWYLDFRGYKGVNRASTAEECAELLKVEGYATDEQYSQKLIRIMRDQMQ